MAAAGRIRSEDQFLCSICLEVFTDPVSTSCGHNFCRSCISEHWRVNVPYHCPMCKEVFNSKPQLKINTFIKEMVTQFKREAQHEPNISSSNQQAVKPGEVPCDVCTQKALKSCLVCLTSYCHTHLEPHLTLPGLKRHQLIHPVENLEDRMCGKHDKPLELFCKTDSTCICLLCPVMDHKNHEFVPLKEEYEKQKAELKKTEGMIQERRLKIQEIQRSVELSKNTADRETAEGVEVFTALMESVQRGLAQVQEEIQEKQRTTEKRAEDFIKELELEICELEKRSAEVEQLSHCEDHLHFVQRFTSVKAAPPMKTWTNVSVWPPSYEGTVVKALSELEKKLRKGMKMLAKAELKKTSTEVEQPSGSEDHAHFAPRATSVKPAPSVNNQTTVNTCSPSGKVAVVRGVSEKKVSKAEQEKRSCEAKQPSHSEDFPQLVPQFTGVKADPCILSPTAWSSNKLVVDRKKQKMAEIRRFEVDVTLDPETANPFLILSDDRKQVYTGDKWQDVPQNPRRFYDYCNVLGMPGCSSGKFYYEVQVTGKTDWSLGVVSESFTRKGKHTTNPLRGYWVIRLTNGYEYSVFEPPRPVALSVKPGLQKVGVFVDYERRLVSFYDADSSAHLHTYSRCYFSKKVMPFFSPHANCKGTNAAPLVITSVKH